MLKNKCPDLKKTKDLTFFQRRHTDDQQANEKMVKQH